MWIVVLGIKTKPKFQPHFWNPNWISFRNCNLKYLFDQNCLCMTYSTTDYIVSNHGYLSWTLIRFDNCYDRNFTLPYHTLKICYAPLFFRKHRETMFILLIHQSFSHSRHIGIDTMESGTIEYGQEKIDSIFEIRMMEHFPLSFCFIFYSIWNWYVLVYKKLMVLFSLENLKRSFNKMKWNTGQKC